MGFFVDENAARPSGCGARRLIERARCFGVLMLLAALWSPPANACGGGAVTQLDASVGVDVQRILLSARRDKTEVITQIVVPKTADYGVFL